MRKRENGAPLNAKITPRISRNIRALGRRSEREGENGAISLENETTLIGLRIRGGCELPARSRRRLTGRLSVRETVSIKSDSVQLQGVRIVSVKLILKSKPLSLLFPYKGKKLPRYGVRKLSPKEKRLPSLYTSASLFSFERRKTLSHFDRTRIHSSGIKFSSCDNPLKRSAKLPRHLA